MLENLAIQYISQPEESLNAIGFVVVAIGFIIAGVTNKSRVELGRAPYFAYTAFFFFSYRRRR